MSVPMEIRRAVSRALNRVRTHPSITGLGGRSYRAVCLVLDEFERGEA